MPTRNITLTDALDRFVAEQVASSAFEDASEVVREGLRLLKAEQELRAAKLDALRAAVQAGIDSGPGIAVDDIDAFFEEIDAEIEAEIAAEETAARATAAE